LQGRPITSARKRERHLPGRTLGFGHFVTDGAFHAPHDSIDGVCASQIIAAIIDAPPASECTRLVSGSRARAHHQASRSTSDFPLEAHHERWSGVRLKLGCGLHGCQCFISGSPKHAHPTTHRSGIAGTLPRYLLEETCGYDSSTTPSALAARCPTCSCHAMAPRLASWPWTVEQRQAGSLFLTVQPVTYRCQGYLYDIRTSSP